jgi:hypothetical protein
MVTVWSLYDHYRIKDYRDYDDLSDSFKSSLVYHALVGLRAVMSIHLHHRKPSLAAASAQARHTIPSSNSNSNSSNSNGGVGGVGGELRSLLQQCARISCSVLQGGRAADRGLPAEAEAVRLLLTCGRVDVSLLAVAYHAGVFILRRELQPKPRFEDVLEAGAGDRDSELPAFGGRDRSQVAGRARAMTDAAVNLGSGSRSSRKKVGSLEEDNDSNGGIYRNIL